MKKFILNLGSFLLLCLTFNIIVFVFSQERYFKDYIKLPEKKYRSFIFADSHGLPLSNYSEKFGIYNFAAGSDSYFDIKRKIDFLLEKGYQLESVYITVDDHTLSPFRERTNNLDRSVRYVSLTSVMDYLHFFKKKYLVYYLPVFSPKVRSLVELYLKSRFNPKKHNRIDTLQNQWWSNLTIAEKTKRSEYRKKLHFPTTEVSKNLQNELIEIIEICEKNNIELVGVKYPLSKTYNDILGESNYKADSVFRISDLRVYDYKVLFNDRDIFFANEDHLNSTGGKAFAETLFGN